MLALRVRCSGLGRGEEGLSYSHGFPQAASAVCLTNPFHSAPASPSRPCLTLAVPMSVTDGGVQMQEAGGRWVKIPGREVWS